MRPFTRTLPLAEALTLALDAVRPVTRTEDVPLAAAHDRVLSEEVKAKDDVPPFARSAMDGYAVLAGDLAAASREHPVRLPCVAVVYAGQAPPPPLRQGTCVEIATGAPTPPGPVAVVMVEETARDGTAIVFTAPARQGQNTSRRGSDIEAGQVVGHAGDHLTPARLGALAAVGVASVPVFARPLVAIASTGNEVAEAGAALAPGAIYDVNRYTLAAIATAHGGTVTTFPPVGDTKGALLARLDEMTGHDLVILSGGSSVGERDLIVDAVADRGEVIFHGIAVKPGKPTLLARIGGAILLGMPGNPTSCLSNAYILLIPMLRRMASLPPHRPSTTRAVLTHDIASAHGRHQFYSVRLVDGRAEPAFKGSGDITSLSRADGYFEIAADVDSVAAGTEVVVTLF